MNVCINNIFLLIHSWLNCSRHTRCDGRSENDNRGSDVVFFSVQVVIETTALYAASVRLNSSRCDADYMSRWNNARINVFQYWIKLSSTKYANSKNRDCPRIRLIIFRVSFKINNGLARRTELSGEARAWEDVLLIDIVLKGNSGSDPDEHTPHSNTKDESVANLCGLFKRFVLFFSFT